MKGRGERRDCRPAPKFSGSRRARLLSVVISLAAVAVVGAALASGFLLRGLPWDGNPSAGPKTAAIVDQLGLTAPNPTFVETVTKTLEEGGYRVDYYPGEQVTVDFYRNLPAQRYDLIVLRVHSGLARDEGEPTDYVSLFTGEPFDSAKHYEEGEAKLLGRARYYDGSPEVYGIVPAFIESSMVSRFHGTTIVMMGCDGLVTDSTAEALIKKGAKVVVGWNGPVSATHSDKTAELLLRHLVLEEYPAREAVALTMTEVGPDPDYSSALLTYPSKG